MDEIATMLGFGWLALRQAQEALKNGRLEEVQRLLAQSAVQGYRRKYPLLEQLAQAFVERGERNLRREDVAGAWHDLLQAEQAGATEGNAARLRQALTRLGLAEVRALLEAGEPGRAAEAAADLRGRAVRPPELGPLEEAAQAWAEAREAADRGEFAQGANLLERVQRLAGPLAALSQANDDLQRRSEACDDLLVQLHEAAQQARWQDVLQVSGKVLALAPQHPEARRVRSQAWRVLEPVTIVNPKGPREAPREEAPAEPAPQRLLLWIDGVGGYLVCLGNRVTFGQATPESTVDIPVFADVSRLHASLQRDAEGYLLEAVRPVQVNGQPVSKALLRTGDRITLGNSCQFQFRQPVPVSTSARFDLVSGHRLRLAVEAVLMMADTLVLGPGPHAHVTMPDLEKPIILFRQKDGLGIRHAGNFRINGQPCSERAALEPGVTVAGDDFALALEVAHRTAGRAG
jgi:hypothetical protein